jgi:hypothetical protein
MNPGLVAKVISEQLSVAFIIASILASVDKTVHSEAKISRSILQILLCSGIDLNSCRSFCSIIDIMFLEIHLFLRAKSI